MKSILYSLPFLLIISCDSEVNEDPKQDSESAITRDEVILPIPAVENSYALETYENENGTWGYRILNNGSLFINQPHIPAVQGNLGFSSQEKSEIAGNFALSKLNQGIVPPTVSYSELDSLGVLSK